MQTKAPAVLSTQFANERAQGGSSARSERAPGWEFHQSGSSATLAQRLWRGACRAWATNPDGLRAQS